MTDRGDPQRSTEDAEFVAVESAIAAEDAIPLPPRDGSERVPVVVNAALWTAAGFGILQAVRFVSSMLLTRLVEKSVYGVIATANLYYYGLHMFSDLGVRQCVVNSSRGDERRFLNTAWTLQLLRGFFLWACSFAICVPLAWYYSEPAYLWLLPFLGASAVFDGAVCTAALTMSRRLRRDRIVVRELSSVIASTTIMLVWLFVLKKTAPPGDALEGRQLLAFAAGTLLTNVFDTLLSYTYIRGERNSLAWDREASRELLHFGGWVFISTACTYLANNLDRLYVSQIGEETMADYYVASQLARLPTLLVISLGHQLLFPLYCRLLRGGISLANSLAQIHVAMVGFAGWQVAGAVVVCPTVIRLVYPEKYAEAADYVTWLCVGSWFTVLQTSAEVALLAQGRTRQMAIGQVVKLCLLAPMLMISYRIDGIRGVCISFAAAEAARYFVLAGSLARQGLPIIRFDLLLTSLVALSAAIGLYVGPTWELPEGHKLTRLGPRLLGEVLIVSAFWGAVLAGWWRRHGSGFMSIIRQPGT
ncbi:MAG: oligosaccharide flippase family protein [Gemmataceae bacterium]|nr:oligosaccharide flippase family protein [Gemmataceae bacterium]